MGNCIAKAFILVLTAAKLLQFKVGSNLYKSSLSLMELKKMDEQGLIELKEIVQKMYCCDKS